MHSDSKQNPTDTVATQKASVAVIGGGMTGIATALELAKSGQCVVTVFEKEPTLGGLSAPYTWQDVTWDRFYHVVLSTDGPLLELIAELGLSDKMFWRETKVGFYGKGKLVSFSSLWDFIAFPFMNPWQKVRLVCGILYSARIKDPAKLDKIYVRAWLTKVFGRRVFEKLWDPLLRSKLGSAREKTSAAFIWSTITRLYGARSESGAKREQMGHVQGGYETILNAARDRLTELGVTVLCNAETTAVIPEDATRDKVAVTCNGNTVTFDRAIITTPCPVTLALTNANTDDLFWSGLQKVEYLAISCVLLILSRGLSPFYVTNLLDPDLPFTGVIEATNIVAPENLGGKHLVYLPKYMPNDDPYMQKSDEEIRIEFIAKLKTMFPDLRDEEILHSVVAHERYVQPLQEVNYLSRLHGFKSPLANIFVVNTAMIYNSTLNNNAAVTLGRDCAREVLVSLEKAR
ncbi:NAD(P)/FAD-dependent oxidoreductase [Gemmatimonas aurantiaca]|nr:NAD(P)/FAD-dependent oxidoreductase [Gemmatimonas aurantiaca]